MRQYLVLTAFLVGCSSITKTSTAPEVQQMQIPTAATVTTDIAGRAAAAVRQGVLRVICRPTGFGGTGFLHKSGNVITAAHVVNNCKPVDVILVTPGGNALTVSSIQADDALDVALLRATTTVPGQALSIGTTVPPALGMQVATWGYPGGYDGLAPLLSVGFLAGTQDFKDSSGKTVQRWVVNAAFNGGNSGGPVLSLEDGSIVGIVSSKLAPLPTHVATILDLLGKQTSGFVYEATKPDGSKVTFTEGQLIGEVLQYLRGQVQLVIGYAVSRDDLVKFLNARNVAP
jgi:S1-C subfamily serine protease